MSRLIDADALRKCFEVPHELKCGIQAGMDEYALKCIDEQPTVNPWHRVEEPPKIGVPVLVTYIGYNTGETRCDLVAAYDGIAWRYWDDEMLDEVMVEITHWMPIEPPKEDA